MDRREAMLRELNLYPQWVRRERHAPAVAEQPVSVAVEQPVSEALPAVRADETTDRTTSHLTNPAKDAGQVIGYSHSTKLSKNDSQVAGYELVEARTETAGTQSRPSTSSGRTESDNLPSTSPELQLGNLDWPELKQQVRDCQLCKLRAGCMQTVFGVGDENADWLFVGEGPGADEDALGEPFVGQAGKLLDNMLMAIKLKRGKNVYIANIVKCRPPENRNPAADEIAQCLPYLERQIELIQPKLIVALGKVASNALLMEPLATRLGEQTTPAKSLVIGKEATLASLRGKLHDYRGIPLIVTYHPAYLLRTPSEKAKVWQDLCLAVKTLEGDA